MRPEFLHDFCQRRGVGWGFDCSSCGCTTFPGEIADEDRVRKLREMVRDFGAATTTTPTTITADTQLSCAWSLLELGKAEAARGRRAEALQLLHTVEGLLKVEGKGHEEFIRKRKVRWEPWNWWAHPSSFVVEEEVPSSFSSFSSQSSGPGHIPASQNLQ